MSTDGVARMRSRLKTTSYAVLGLLTLREQSGYEVKRTADMTLRFFYFSPAMSHVYTELQHLADAGLVASREVPGPGRRTTRLFRLTADGAEELRRWLADEPVGFPVLKHSVALRLFLGHLVDPERTRRVLDDYVRELRQRIVELEAIRASIGDDPARSYPALVAEWGQRFYRGEIDTVGKLAERLPGDGPGGPATAPGRAPP